MVPSQLSSEQLEDSNAALLKSEARRYTTSMKAFLSPTSDSNIDVQYYKLNLHIATSPNCLRGIVTTKARSTVASLASVSFDLMNSMSVDSVKSENMRLSFVQHPTTVLIELNRSYGFDQMVVLDVYY